MLVKAGITVKIAAASPSANVILISTVIPPCDLSPPFLDDMFCARGSGSAKGHKVQRVVKLFTPIEALRVSAAAPRLDQLRERYRSARS